MHVDATCVCKWTHGAPPPCRLDLYLATRLLVVGVHAMPCALRRMHASHGLGWLAGRKPAPVTSMYCKFYYGNMHASCRAFECPFQTVQPGEETFKGSRPSYPVYVAQMDRVLQIIRQAGGGKTGAWGDRAAACGWVCNATGKPQKQPPLVLRAHCQVPGGRGSACAASHPHLRDAVGAPGACLVAQCGRASYSYLCACAHLHAGTRAICCTSWTRWVTWRRRWSRCCWRTGGSGADPWMGWLFGRLVVGCMVKAAVVVGQLAHWEAGVGGAHDASAHQPTNQATNLLPT